MKSNVPELRFKDGNGNDFPDWEERKLGDVCEKKPSNVSANSLENAGGDYKIYGAAGYLQNIDFYREEEPYISIVKDGAGIGRALLCEAKSSVLSTLDIIKPRDGNNLDFLLAILNRTCFTKYIIGSAIPHIYFRDYSKEQIKLPCKEEQEKIGSFLASVDRRISLLVKKKALLEDYKKGAMQQVFSQKIRFRDGGGNAFPDWGEDKFEDIFSSVPTRPFQIKSGEILSDGEYRVIDQGQNKIAGYSNEKAKVFSGREVIVYGDHTTMVKYVDFDFIAGADGTKVLEAKGVNSTLYLYYCLSHNNIKPEGYKRHFSILKDISLPIPSVGEQVKIGSFLASLDKKIGIVRQQIEGTKKYKQGLLQQMFI